ncbi:MAG TPA: hypothetical protein VM689_06610 [Aliidongia sp.]|nr:hypothetical protein [Aliidongia sp.]
MSTKQLFAFLDLSLIEEIPQALQHILVKDAVAKVGAELTFYSAENSLTLEAQTILRTTFRKPPKIDGFIFYRLQQFSLGGPMNIDLMREILVAGYSLYFVRERLSLGTVQELDTAHAHLQSFAFANDRARRTALLSQVKSVLKESGLDAISLVG